MSSSDSKKNRKTPGKNGKKKRTIPSTHDYKIFFDRMEAGTLKVDIHEGRVYVKFRGKWIEPYVWLDDSDQNRAYRFVRVYKGEKRRAIAIHRLVWMVHNRVESIPAGFDVAHDDDDPGNNAYWNLDLEPSAINQRHDSVEEEYDF